MIIEIDRLNLNQRWLIASIRKLKRFFFFRTVYNDARAI